VGQIVFVAAYLQDTEEKCAARKLEEILKNHGLDLEHIEAETSRVSHGKVDDYVKNDRSPQSRFCRDEIGSPTGPSGKSPLLAGGVVVVGQLPAGR